MPTYPLECPKCNTTEDIFCSYKDLEGQLPCPTCGTVRTKLICAPGMMIIHDCQGRADLFHKRVMFKNGKSINTTDGYGSRYYYKNNKEEDPRLIQRKMESDAEKKTK